MGQYKEPPRKRKRLDVLMLLIYNELGVDEAKMDPDAQIVKDLGADSLDCIEVVMAVEEEFGIEIPDAEAEEWRTIRDIDKYLGEHGIEDEVLR